MFFTLQQMRQNRENERRWEERFDQLQKDMLAEREEHQARMAEHRAWREDAYRALQEDKRRVQAAEQQQQIIMLQTQNQQIIELLAQNQQLMGMLLDLLERRNDPAVAAPSD